MPTRDIRPAHEEALHKLEEEKGVVYAHSTGSGKTSLSLEAADRLGGNSLFITPASLVGNVEKERLKFKFKSKPEVLSYEKAINDIHRLNKKKYNLIVFDEAHKLRNATSERSKVLGDLAAKAQHRMLLTATPIFNRPSDLGRLVNIAAADHKIPEDPKKFHEEFTETKTVQPSFWDRIVHGAQPYTKESLVIPKKYQEDLISHVHHYDATEESAEHFPSIEEHVVPVEMSRRQQKLTHFYTKKLPTLLRWKIKMGVPPEKRDISKLNTFSSALRQISNDTRQFSKHPEDEAVTPKIKTAVSHLAKMHHEDKNFRAFVYSNYIGAGLQPYSDELKKQGIGHEIIDGSMSKNQRTEIVKRFNAGKTKVLLGSGAASAGLDLKGTKLVQTLEPAWENSTIKQVVGRASRYKSHSHLPPEERKVRVEHYHSTLPGEHSIDEYLHMMAKEKEKTSKPLWDLIKRHGYQSHMPKP